METKGIFYKLISQAKFFFFIVLASFSTTAVAEYYLVSPGCGDTCFMGVTHYYHHKRHHHRHRHHHWRGVTSSSITFCTEWSPGYAVYTDYPNYGTLCNTGAGYYDPPNLSPYQDDINADDNMTY